MTSSTCIPPDLQTFRDQAVAPGIYAAISLPGEGSLSNAGIVHLGESTLTSDAEGAS